MVREPLLNIKKRCEKSEASEFAIDTGVGKLENSLRSPHKQTINVIAHYTNSVFESNLIQQNRISYD